MEEKKSLKLQISSMFTLTRIKMDFYKALSCTMTEWLFERCIEEAINNFHVSLPLRLLSPPAEIFSPPCAALKQLIRNAITCIIWLHSVSILLTSYTFRGPSIHKIFQASMPAMNLHEPYFFFFFCLIAF